MSKKQLIRQIGHPYVMDAMQWFSITTQKTMRLAATFKGHRNSRCIYLVNG